MVLLPRVTARYTPDSEPSSLKKVVFFIGLNTIFRAGWIKNTISSVSNKRAKYMLV